eukprot:880088-Pyramimonas_sp.AAC.1
MMRMMMKVVLMRMMMLLLMMLKMMELCVGGQKTNVTCEDEAFRMIEEGVSKGDIARGGHITNES